MKTVKDEPGTAADLEAEGYFSEQLLKAIFADNDGKPRLKRNEADTFCRACREDYKNLEYTTAQLEQDLQDCQEAESFLASLGQRLLAQRAGIRASAARTLLATGEGGSIQ